MNAIIKVDNDSVVLVGLTNSDMDSLLGECVEVIATCHHDGPPIPYIAEGYLWLESGAQFGQHSGLWVAVKDPRYNLEKSS